jgi:hypothetical protein
MASNGEAVDEVHVGSLHPERTNLVTGGVHMMRIRLAYTEIRRRE